MGHHLFGPGRLGGTDEDKSIDETDGDNAHGYVNQAMENDQGTSNEEFTQQFSSGKDDRHGISLTGPNDQQNQDPMDGGKSVKSSKGA